MRLIGGITILIALFIILTGIANAVNSGLFAIEQYFFHSTAGLISLVCGGLAILLLLVSTQMPKVIRESSMRIKAFAPALKWVSKHGKDGINSIKKIKRINGMKKELKQLEEETQENVIDMENMSLEGFFREVAFTLNKPSPVIFKAWGIRRLQMDAERVRQLGNYIESVRETADQYLKLRADMFFSKEKFEHFVKANRINAENDLDLIQEKYKTAKHSEEYERRKKNADMRDREIEQEERLAKIREQNARNEFFTMAIKEFPEMPAPLKAYMFTQVHGRYPEAKRDFDIEEKITAYILKKYENEATNMDLETKKKEEEVKTQIDKLKHEREKKYG